MCPRQGALGTEGLAARKFHSHSCSDWCEASLLDCSVVELPGPFALAAHNAPSASSSKTESWQQEMKRTINNIHRATLAGCPSGKG